MRKLLLVILLLVAAFWAFTQMYTIKTGKNANGQYSIVVVNNTDGAIHKLMGD